MKRLGIGLGCIFSLCMGTILSENDALYNAAVKEDQEGISQFITPPDQMELSSEQREALAKVLIDVLHEQIQMMKVGPYSAALLASRLQEIAMAFSVKTQLLVNEFIEYLHRYRTANPKKMFGSVVTDTDLEGIIEALERSIQEEDDEQAAQQTITPEDFNTVIAQATKPVIVKVFMSTCPPCQALKPIFHKVSQKFADDYDFYSMEMNGTSYDFFKDTLKIESVPTLLFIKDGAVVDKHEGFLDYEELVDRIEQAFMQK